MMRRSSAAAAVAHEQSPDLAQARTAECSPRTFFEESARERIDREIRACALKTRLGLWAPPGVLRHGC